MKVVYTGSVRRVFIPQLRDLEVERGVPVEVPDAIGVSLLEQRVWQPAGETVPFAEWTVEGLKQLSAEWGLHVPSGAKKAELVALLEAEAKRRAAIDAPPIDASGDPDDAE